MLSMTTTSLDPNGSQGRFLVSRLDLSHVLLFSIPGLRHILPEVHSQLKTPVALQEEKAKRPVPHGDIPAARGISNM